MKKFISNITTFEKILLVIILVNLTLFMWSCYKTYSKSHEVRSLKDLTSLKEEPEMYQVYKYINK